VNNTIRLRDGRCWCAIRLTGRAGAGSCVAGDCAYLLAKMYRRPIDRAQAARYRKYVASHEIVRKIHLVRQMPRPESGSVRHAGTSMTSMRSLKIKHPFFFTG